MNPKDIMFLVSLTFILLFFNKVLLSKKDKYYNIIIIILCLTASYSINMHYAQFIMKESRYLMIPFVAVMLVATFIATLNYESLKLSIDNLILIVILINSYMYFNNGMINDYVKYIQIFILYLSIFCIGFLYKNIKYYDYKKILNFFSYVAIFNFILGIMQYITGKKLLPGVFNESIMYSEGAVGAKRIVGIAGTNNAAGNLSAILFAIVMYNYLTTKRKIHLVAILGTLVFSMLTLTRIGYLAIAVECLIFFSITQWNTLRKIVNKLGIIFIGLFSGGIIIWIWGYKIYDILFLRRGDTTSARTIQFTKLFQHIIPNNDFWSGVGPGQYKYYMFYNIGYWDIDLHSQYLNVLAEQGTFIFILFIIFNIYIFRCALKKCENKLEKAFVTSVFIGNLICSNYNPNQYYYVNNVLYYLTIYCFVYKIKEKELHN